MEISAVRMQVPADANLILGRSHFIKTVEDLYECLVNTVPGVEFGIAFNEASGPCLIRHQANQEELGAAAIANAQAIGAGHFFVILVRKAYPINLLGRIKEVPEVCEVLCATANPVEVLVVQTAQGRGVVGVVDGSSPKGVEGPADVQARKQFLRQIGYKQ